MMSSTSRPIFIATRGSALALAQSKLVLTALRAAFPGEEFELKIIKTTGDKLQTASLASSDLPKGLFTKELEVALLNGEADLAVHSLKDLPTDLPAGLILGAVSQREDVRDVLVWRQGSLEPDSAKQGSILHRLPPGAVVATSSTRRSAQVLEHRPDLKIVPIRGNLGTRLRKVAGTTEFHATILAAAGLKRLGFKTAVDGGLSGPDAPPDLHAGHLSTEEMLPCVGQAAIGIEIREKDQRLEKICAAYDDAETHACVLAERAFLRAMGGGCHLAVAALGEVLHGQIDLRVVSFLGGKAKYAQGMRPVHEAESLGREMAGQVAERPCS
jgi:hydroxymethylbilane synthase